ncbi:MAG: D-alanyl-D-alanine carboxypeptidase [Bacilli bacterium]|nr:D-alanyl-D-alanine carboxypeptidase [Bacilli bacterium]
MKKFLLSLMIIIMLVFPFCQVMANEEGLATTSKSAILIEASTGDIIFEKNSHEKLAPASMTKMMTMLIIIESIEKKVIGWDDVVTVSENASKMGGSQILLETGEKMSVKDLFKGIAIASGNDASVALAEQISGTEANFVSTMNKRVKELGLKTTNFKNVHGLDVANHYSSAYDMAMIAKELVKHEEVLKYTSIYEDYLRIDSPRKIWLVNTNKLVRFYDGVDGLKTGYTSESGYCLTATAKKSNSRFIATVMGIGDSKTRNAEISEMLNFAFAQYETEQLLSKNSIIGTVEVEKGKNKYVDIVPLDNVTVLNKKGDQKKNITYEVEIEKIKAPIKKGDIVGELLIKENDNITRRIGITVKENIEKANFIQLYFRYLKDIFIGDVKI